MPLPTAFTSRLCTEDQGQVLLFVRKGKRQDLTPVCGSLHFEGRGLAAKAIVGASMRKLVHLIYGVVKSGQPFNTKIAMSALEFQEGI